MLFNFEIMLNKHWTLIIIRISRELTVPKLTNLCLQR